MEPTEELTGRHHTPGFLGYVAALVVAWLVATVLVVWVVGMYALVDLEALPAPSDIGVGVLIVTGAAGVATAVAGPIGVAIVDVACDRFAQQWVHVAAAAAVAGLPVLAAAWWFTDGTYVETAASVLVAAIAAVAAAVGRWAVVPLVPVVRERRAPRQE